MDPFESLQWLLLFVIGVATFRFFKVNRPPSGFKPMPKPGLKRAAQEPDLSTDPALREADKKRARLLLEGIVLVGLPHQILGVRQDASEFEIRKAHRNLIKRFHPDKVGEQGSRAWYEAQRASEAINGARDEMLAQLARGSNHDGA
ncbi:MAG: J domain-containing protein [Oligoflexia bacterium]